MKRREVIALVAGILAALDREYRTDRFPGACVSDAERIVAKAYDYDPDDE